MNVRLPRLGDSLLSFAPREETPPLVAAARAAARRADFLTRLRTALAALKKDQPLTVKVPDRAHAERIIADAREAIAKTLGLLQFDFVERGVRKVRGVREGRIKA